MKTTKTPKAHAPYQPPQPTLAHCPGCDALVLTKVATWDEASHDDPKTGRSKLINVPIYVPLAPPVSPVTGTPHDCEEALAWSLRVHGIRWNSVRVMAQQRDTVT
jgi:hypothetical protein